MRASAEFVRLALADRAERAEALQRGARLEPGDVAGAEWRGWNCGLPFGLVLARKFFKRFHPPDGYGQVYGENVLAWNNGLERPWRPLPGGKGILPMAALLPGRTPIPDAPRQALVISYGAWDRSRLNPIGRVLDHIVRPDPSRPDLLLGDSWFRLPGGKPVFIEHFLLERVRR